MKNETKDKSGTVMGTRCQVCGGELIRRGKRPPTLCSDNGRDIAKFTAALESRLGKVKFHDEKHKQLIRGNMFRLRNFIT